MTRRFELRSACFGCAPWFLFFVACSGTPPAESGGPNGAAAGSPHGAGQGGSADVAGSSNDSAGAGGTPDETTGSAGAPITAGRHGGTAGRGGGAGASAAASGGASGVSGGMAGEGSMGSGGSPGPVMVPCDVYAAYRVCRDCHIDPPVNGAPMPLLTLLDLQTYAAAEYQAISIGVMPAAGTLTSDEATLILDWLATGATGVPQMRCP